MKFCYIYHVTLSVHNIRKLSYRLDIYKTIYKVMQLCSGSCERKNEIKAGHKHCNIFMQLCKCKEAKRREEEAGQ